MKNRPIYGLASVDRALHLSILLQQEGPLRVADVASRIGVAQSTAHRLLAMLVYRDFAQQLPDRRYAVGPTLRRPVAPEPTAELRKAALPHLRALTRLTNETTHVMVVVGDDSRIVASAVSEHLLAVGDREGRVLDTHRCAGGRAVLAGCAEADLVSHYARSPAVIGDLGELLRDLRRVRRQGFAFDDQAVAGVVAVGCRILGPEGRAPAAVSITLPAERYRRERLPELVSRLAATAAHISRELHCPTPAVPSVPVVPSVQPDDRTIKPFCKTEQYA